MIKGENHKLWTVDFGLKGNGWSVGKRRHWMMKKRIIAIGRKTAGMWSVAIVGEKGVAATTYTSSRKVFHFSSKDPGQKCWYLIISDHFWIIISWGPDQNHHPGYHLVLKQGLKQFAAGTNIICLPSISGSHNKKKYVRVPFKPFKSASKMYLIWA